jgi:hypothetical protein
MRRFRQATPRHDVKKIYNLFRNRCGSQLAPSALNITSMAEVCTQGINTRFVTLGCAKVARMPVSIRSNESSKSGEEPLVDGCERPSFVVTLVTARSQAQRSNAG